MKHPAPWPPRMRERTAAQYLDVSTSWLRNQRCEDKCRLKKGEPIQSPPHHLVGRTVWYIKTDLDRWLESLYTPSEGVNEEAASQHSSGVVETAESGAPTGAQEVGHEAI